MGVWDKTTPAGSDSARDGDDRIREKADALEEALSHEDSTFPGATPGSTPIFIPGFLRGATGSRPTSDSLVEGRFYVNTTLNVLERYNGSSWDAVGTVIPSGTKMVFFQSAAPTGWTIDASNNDKALRVVSSSGGGTGGTHAVSTGASHTHTINNHTHTIPNHQHSSATDSVASHAQDTNAKIGSEGNSAGALQYQLVAGGVTCYQLNNGTATDGGGGATGNPSDTGMDTIAPIVQYIDVIVATKD